MQARKYSNRRDFLRLAALGAAGTVVLAACGGPAPEPTAAPAAKPAESKPAEQAKPTAAAAAAPAKKPTAPISFLCRNDIVTAYNVDPIIEEWNKTHDSKITMEKPAGDVRQKAAAALASGDMVWDGFSVAVSPYDNQVWVKQGLIQPMDDLIKASTEKDADKVLPGMIGTIREAVKVDGKVYFVPGNVGSYVLQWFWDPLKEIGVTKQPETWDETADIARKLKAKFSDKTPYAAINTPGADFIGLMWSAVKPAEIIKDNKMNITHPDAVAGLKWMKALAKEKLTPTVTTDVNANWDKGGVVMMMAYDVKGQHAQKTYGYDKADTGVTILKEKGNIASGTHFWMNGSVIFNKAKNPQGMMDFFLWWFGPNNEPAQKTMIATAAKPCYQYTYDKYVKDDPNFKWENLGIDLVAKSTPYPVNTYWTIENDALTPWIQKFMADDSTISAEDAMASAAKDIDAAIAKQKL
jgi:hypothetical protein